jgi:hypothetical protein
MQKLFRIGADHYSSVNFTRHANFAVQHVTLKSAYARRHFVCGLFVGLLVVAFPGRVTAQGPAAPNVLRIGILTTVSANAYVASVERGVRLGAAEAKQTANLFGSDVQLLEARAGSDPVASATKLLSQRKVDVLIGTSPADAEALSRLAEQRHVLFLNAASRSQALRAQCRRYTLHVQASEGMYNNALLAERQAFARGDRTPSRAAAPDSVVLWSSTLQRYGAAQINDRFRAKYHSGMDGGAWAGWVAVKIAAESALRGRSTEPARLLIYLESPATTFDGHKGWPLSFRIADHQLRQPLYTVAHAANGSSAAIVHDVPELRGDSPTNGNEPARLNQSLDRLIAAPTAPRCQWLAR